MGKVFWFITFAVLLRLLLMPFTYHSDIQTFDLAGYLIRSGVGLNFYDYLPNQKPDSPILKTYPSNLFNYPPMVYFFLGGVDNLTTVVTPIEVREKFLFDVKSVFGDWRANLHLLFLKLIYIPFDIGVALILWKMSPKQWKIASLCLWLFNPVVIFGIYMMGQFDIIPAFLSLWAVYLVSHLRSPRSIWWAALMLGIGASFKIYPLLLLPVLASLEIPWVKRIGIILLGIGAYVLSISAFLGSEGFRSTALVAGQTMKSLYAQIPLSGGESVMLYIAALVFGYLMFYFRPSKVTDLASRMMILLLIFFMFTHFHPQWFLWIVPFLVLDLVKTNFRSLLSQLVIYLSWFGSLWLFDSGMTIGMFSPIWPDLYNGPMLWQIIGLNIDINFARSLLASIFFGGCLSLMVINYYRPSQS